MARQDDAASQAPGAAAGEWDQFGPAYDHPPFEGPRRTFVIASTPRSGSHLLGHLLHATGRLGSPLEYLHPRHLATWQERLGQPDRAATLRAIMARRTSPSGWFGIKAHWPQFAAVKDDVDVMAQLDVRGWVRIGRADRVAQAVSLAIARQTNAWISFHEPAREPAYAFEDVARAVRDLEEQERSWDHYLADVTAPLVTVTYEELVADRQVVADRVCRALGVEPPRELPGAGTTRQADERNAEWRERYLADSRDGGR